MIRRIEPRDLEACTDLAIEFFDPFLTAHGVPLIREDLKNSISRHIAMSQAIVVEHDKQVQGVAAWLVINHPANAFIKIFFETLWCVKSKFKADALLLLRNLEHEARKAGADLMLMSNLSEKHEQQLKCIFTNMGFEFIETHYGKIIKGGKICGRGQSNHSSQ